MDILLPEILTSDLISLTPPEHPPGPLPEHPLCQSVSQVSTRTELEQGAIQVRTQERVCLMQASSAAVSSKTRVCAACRIRQPPKLPSVPLPRP